MADLQHLHMACRQIILITTYESLHHFILTVKVKLVMINGCQHASKKTERPCNSKINQPNNHFNRLPIVI